MAKSSDSYSSTSSGSSIELSPEGTPLLCMDENEPAVWAYGNCGVPGALRLFSVEKLLGHESRSIDLYEWEKKQLKWPRGTSGLIPVLESPPGMPCYAAISHTWEQSEDVLRRIREANRSLLIETGLEKPHEISWLGLVQAATAARELKCQYLWLDLLCLNQLSKDDKKLQISNMHNIYSNAAAVIVMFGGVGAAQGLDQASTWINRAWTLQEATLCHETWGLVDWKYKGKSFFTTEHHTEFTRLDGDLAIARVRDLLEYRPGESLGEVDYYPDDKRAKMDLIELDLPVYCLGREPSSASALASAISAMQIDSGSDNGDSSDENSTQYGNDANEDEQTIRHKNGESGNDSWEDISDSSLGSISGGEGLGEEGSEGNSYFDEEDPDTGKYIVDERDVDEDDDDVESYDSDKDSPEIRYGAAWRSMWLRTSTKPQDMVFSTMHLLDATIEVDYSQSLESLVFKLVEKTSSIPAWLTIGYDIPVMPNSGLIPLTPTFTAQSEPTYLIDGRVAPAASMVSGDYRCHYFDMRIKSTHIVNGHLICARMLEVKHATAPEKWLKNSSFDYQSDVRLSSPDYDLSTTCRFKGRMGSIVAIVGKRLTHDDLRGWSSDLEPFIYLLGKNESGVWQKTGGGTLEEALFWQLDDLNSIERRHLQVGGGAGATVVPCNCDKSKAKAKAIASTNPSTKPLTYGTQEDLDEELRDACSRGSEKKVQQLLRIGANVNAEGGYYGNALQAACAEGKDRIIELLIERGADIHAQGGHHGNALQAACYQGNHRVVRTLIENGVDVNIQGGFHGNALQAAARWDNDAVVQLLINAGANVNVEGGEDGDALTSAASCGNLSAARILVHNGANVEGHGGRHGSPLMAAANSSSENSLQVVHLLLENGANVNAKSFAETQDGRHVINALQSACRSFKTDVTRLLLENGADVNARGGSYCTALGVAAHYAHVVTCKLLIANGADVNAEGGYWGTALQAAAPQTYGHNEEVMLLLLRHGADVNIQGGPYGNALQAAAFDRKEQAVRDMIQRGANVNAYGGKFGTALQAAAQSGCGNIARLLIEAGADTNVEEAYVPPLKKALADGYEGMVRRLIDKGCKVNAIGGRYKTALQAASCNDFRELIRLIGGKTDEQSSISDVTTQEHVAVVRLLVERGAKVNARGGRFGSALQAVCFSGSVEIVRYLIASGARVNAKGGYYGYALQAAACRGHETIVRGLVTAGAKVNAQGGRYGTALQAASRYGHRSIVEYLINVGADLNTGVDDLGNSIVGLHGNALLAAAFHGLEMVDLLLSKGASVEGIDDQGRNALHIAAARGDCELIDRLVPLLYVGQERFRTDYLGRAYFHHAALSGSVEAVKRLLTIPVSVNAVDNDGWTALHWAARKGTKSVVRQLIEAGVDPSSKTMLGWLALRVAIFHKNLSLASLLAVSTVSVPASMDSGMAQLNLGTSIRLGVTIGMEEPPRGQIVGFQHHGAFCDGCQFDLFGPVYSCLKCKNFDYCFRCIGPLGEMHIKKNPGHSFKCWPKKGQRGSEGHM